MKRYLLFDSGCSLCTQLARDIEFESDGWLEAKKSTRSRDTGIGEDSTT